MFSVLLAGAPAQASIVWEWSNAGTGTEVGTFTTDGSLAGGQAPAGSYQVQEFSVTASSHGLPLGSVLGGTYSIENPAIGFNWDGGAPTQFWRADGAFPDGFALRAHVPGLSALPNLVSFGINSFVIAEQFAAAEPSLGDPVFVILEEFQTVNLSAVPEPTAALLLLPGLAAAIGLRRLR
jgi:hypothetical protein